MNIETKDIFYTAGIAATGIIGILNLYISFQNRSNSLREHIYKEQIAIINKLFLNLHKLNKEIDELFNNPEKRKNNELDIIVTSIGDIMFENQFLLPNKVTELINQDIRCASEFYKSVITNGGVNKGTFYKTYFTTYNDSLILIKGYYGINNLSRKNRNLHRVPKYVKEIIPE
jgi:hypothetical protein